MDRAVGGVVGKVREVKGLIDHTLSGECSITMEKNTHNSVTWGGGGGNVKSDARYVEALSNHDEAIYFAEGIWYVC